MTMKEENKKLTIYKANKLIEAAYATHSLHEQMLILTCLAVSDPKTLTADTVIRVTVEKFADLAGLDPRGAYDDLKRAAERLFYRELLISDADPDDPAVKKTKARWVQSIDYADGAIKVAFTKRIIPYLSQLDGCFTSYYLRQVSGFTSYYSHRIYELLVQFPRNNERTVTVEWLREHFGLQDSYKRITELKTWVIEPAIKDINEYSNLFVKYSQQKRGKTIVAFVFEYGAKPEERLSAKPKPPAPKAITSPVSPAVQPPAIVPTQPSKRTPEQRVKAREALEAAKKRLGPR